MRTTKIILGGIVCFVASVAACGGSSDAGVGNGGTQAPGVQGGDASASQDGNGGGDAGNGGVSDGGGASDAHVPVDASGIYPAPHPLPPLLHNYGGPVIEKMNLITVTFAGMANRDSYRTFNGTVFPSKLWGTLTQYGVQAGTVGTPIELPDTVSGKTLDNTKDLVPMIQQLVTAGTFPPPDANTLYAFYFPASTTITLSEIGASSCSSFGGYHDYAKVTSNGKSVNAAFAVLPECGGNPVSTITATHEFIEAVTDPYPFTSKTPPDPFTWYVYDEAWFGSGGGEIADACESRGSFTENGSKFATGWSNDAVKAGKNPCQPADPTKVYFGASFETDTVSGLHDTNGGGPDYDSKSFIVMSKGASRDIDVSVYSEAKLSGDVTLSLLGINGQMTTPTITTGVTSTFSQTMGNNGSHSTLTIKVDPSATAGDYPFLVRASLSASEYHSFFAILRIQ